MNMNGKDAPTFVTPVQFRRAQALARAYGHEWGQVLVTLGEEADPLAGTYPGQPVLSLSLPTEDAAIAAAIDERLGPYRSMPGLGFATSHTTGSGRLQWEVRENGAVDIWVRRPGATLVALRRLEEAARTTYSDVSEGMRAALRDLCGTGIEWGAADPSSTLKIEQRAREQGVRVLFASVSPTGEVEIEEKTRWDVTADEDAAEMRHWLALQDALAALGLALPEPRAEVAAALAVYGAANFERVAANDSGDPERIARAYSAHDAAYAATVTPEAPVHSAGAVWK